MSGTVDVAGERRRGAIRFDDGEVAGATTDHLTGPEAALALLSLRAGTFEYHRSTGPGRAEGAPPSMSIASLLMEAARIDDELERLRDLYPGDDARLELHDAERLPGDPLECGIDEVFAVLAARPGSTFRTVEPLLPLSPGKIRLALSWLAAHGLLGQGTSVRPPQPLELEWWGRLLHHGHSGLRVLVGSSPYLAAEDLWPAFEHLAAELLAEPADVTALSDGPLLARVRPNGGGLISLVVLPVQRRHRARFETLVGTSQVVLLTEAASPDELEAYRAVVPPAVLLRSLAAESTAPALTNALRDLALAT